MQFCLWSQGFARCGFFALSELVWDAGELSAALCAKLSQAYLPGLNVVSLCNRGLTSAGLSDLVQSPWPDLLHLDRCNSNLDGLAVTALSESFW